MSVNDYKGELEKNGVIAFVPGGSSMWPTLKHEGQSVIIVPKKERLNKYDVALFLRDNEKYVLHRVIKVLNEGYVMCGDSQLVTEVITENQVVGVMEGFYKGKKYVDCKDEKYLKKTDKWYKSKTRKLRIKLFYAFLPIKFFFKKLFNKKEKNV